MKGLKKYTRRTNVISKENLTREFLFFFIVMLVFIPLWVRFYTGGNLTVLVMGFYSNTGSDSNYNEYYKHLIDNNLTEFSISKIPYILGYGITKLLFYYFVFSFIGFCKNISRINILLMTFLFLLYTMVGMSRGTSFENFESLILLMFATLVRSRVIHKLNFYSKKQLLYILVISAILGIAFIAGKALRSESGIAEDLSGPTSTLDYDSSSFVMELFPLLGMIALGFSGYFTFGLYYTSELFWKIWSNSFSGIMDMIFPLFAQHVDGIDDYRNTLISKGVDMGACWDPDFTSFSLSIGVPILFFLIYELGVISGKSYQKCIMNKDVGNCLLLFLIVYEMISIHIGNFLVVSSSNKILILATVVILHFNLLRKYRYR